MNHEPKELKILVLDDDHSVADSLTMALKLYCYPTTTVYNPDDAMKLIEAHPRDVITDVVMNGYISGIIQLAIELSSHFPACKVLLTSGNQTTAQELSGAGEQGYSLEVLAKPVHPSVILMFGNFAGGREQPEGTKSTGAD